MQRDRMQIKKKKKRKESDVEMLLTMAYKECEFTVLLPAFQSSQRAVY